MQAATGILVKVAEISASAPLAKPIQSFWDSRLLKSSLLLLFGSLRLSGHGRSSRRYRFTEVHFDGRVLDESSWTRFTI